VGDRWFSGRSSLADDEEDGDDEGSQGFRLLAQAQGDGGDHPQVARSSQRHQFSIREASQDASPTQSSQGLSI